MRRKTDKDFKEQVFSMYNGEYEPQSKYITGRTNLEMLHTTCGNIYSVSPSNFLSGYKCPFCSKRPIVTSEIIAKRLNDKYHGEYLLMNNYINNKTYLDIKHTTCGTIYKVRPYNLNSGYGCPNCSSNKPLTLEIVKENISNMTNKEYECISDIYVNNKSPIKIYHTKCQKTYKIPYTHFKCGNRCPFCSDSNNSKGIKIIKKFLEDNFLPYVTEKKFQKCKSSKSNRLLRFDFYIKTKSGLKVLLEFDGEQHFLISSNRTIEDFEFVKESDRIKNNYCKKNNRILLRFHYKQINSLYTDLVKTFNDLEIGKVQRLSKPYKYKEIGYTISD